MAIRDILVHVDSAAAAEQRLRLACELARRFEAHLTGLYVDPELILPAYAEVPAAPMLIDSLQNEVDQGARASEQAFEALTRGAGVAAEWRRTQGYTPGVVVSHARYADLVIVGQGGDEDPRSLCDGVADTVLVESGRPVLVVPWIELAAMPGDRLALAWNASRESARALHDALPFLVGAKSVEVISINPDDADEREGDIPGADICVHLARHGVKATAHRVLASDVDAGSLLLSRVADEGADLLVAGGYGHSRLRELVLGGVTRELLEHMTLPVLFSH